MKKAEWQYHADSFIHLNAASSRLNRPSYSILSVPASPGCLLASGFMINSDAIDVAAQQETALQAEGLINSGGGIDSGHSLVDRGRREKEKASWA